MSTSPTFDERAWGVVERFSLRNLTIAVGIAALLAGVAAVASVRAPEKYESRAVLVIDNPLALATAGDDGTVNKLDRLRGKYATLANTTAIAGPVAERLRAAPGAIIANTEVSPSASTLGLLVVAEAGTSDAAIARAQAMAEGIVDYVAAEHEAYQVPQESRFFFKIVQPAVSAMKTSPSSEGAKKAAAIAFVVALVAGYVVLQMLRVPAVVPDVRERDGTTS